MNEARLASVPLGGHYKLPIDHYPSTEKEKEDMNNVPYSSVIRSIMYLMISTRPDLAHAISVLSRFMSNPGRSHWDAVKWLMRYLKNTMYEGLLFKSSQNEVELLGYTDADYAGDRDKRKSISAYAFTVCGNCLSWKLHLQAVVALSTTEAK
ncbi:secreted RxLR effector protein 161-like [Ziziphus jujuba]|uniref:Secreted RxLR effector protein 161-like n=1 Tax=Ziziphus jujuba TaxID=326968 RepID=A0ABM3IWT7_ZIZJJ|nr:secreted RxLR effector protein 161-like [Ziziphus jujuba]